MSARDQAAGADLRGATLARADLEGADLTGASLPRVDLSTCNLRHVRLSGAWLESTRLHVEPGGEGDRRGFAAISTPRRQGYLPLEQNFRGARPSGGGELGLSAGKANGQALSVASMRSRCTAVASCRPLLFLHWFGDAFAEWLCDYGESLSA